MLSGDPDALPEPLQAYYTFCGGQNALTAPLLATLHPDCGGQNALNEALQAYYTLCGGQNTLSETL